MKNLIAVAVTSLLLASAAFAADLPAKKAASASADAVACPAYGAGFFQIPGGDSCLRIGGYVRSNIKGTLSTVARGTAPYTLTYDYDIFFDAQNNTELGTVRSFLDIETSSTPGTPTDTEVYVEVAGLKAGLFASLAY